MTDAQPKLENAALAGAIYAACVFPIAFVTGGLRTILLATFRALEPVWAVAIALPAILAAAWLACGWALSIGSVPATCTARVMMGLVALFLIVAAEAMLTGAVTGNGLAGVTASYTRPEVLLGLAGQLVFATFPLIRRPSYLSVRFHASDG